MVLIFENKIKSKSKINILLIGFNRSDLISKSIERLKKLIRQSYGFQLMEPRKSNRKDKKEIKKLRRFVKSKRYQIKT